MQHIANLACILLFVVITCYRKRKVREIEEKNRPGGNDKWKIKGKQSWKRAKERRHQNLCTIVLQFTSSEDLNMMDSVRKIVGAQQNELYSQKFTEKGQI